jgi:hypothetical protein
MRIGILLGSILIPGAQGVLAESPFVQPIWGVYFSVAGQLRITE